jgi:hypothetical protein
MYDYQGLQLFSSKRMLRVCAKLSRVVWLGLGLASSAYATLGESEASVQLDQQALGASAPVIQKQNSYQVVEFVLPSETTVRQYVSAKGVVFAVVWKGAALPDLKQLLGRYFDQYANVYQAQRKHSGSADVPLANGLVVGTSGRPGGFYGRALVSDHLPAGVTLQEVK